MNFQMIRLTALNELRQWLRQRALFAALILFFLLEAIVCWQSFRQADAQKVRRSSQQQTAHEDWLSQTTTNAHMATHHGMTVFKIPSPLAAYDPGIDPLLGDSLHLQSHQPGQLTPPENQNSLSLLKLETSTPALLLQMVFPLLIIVLSHGGISREREQGTLELIQSLGTRWTVWTCGKLAALALVVAIYLIPIVVAFAQIARTPGFSHEMEFSNFLIRAAVLTAMLFLYLFGWGALSLGISARVSSSSTALILLLLLWAGWTIILPRLAMDVAQAKVPLPTAEELRDRRRTISEHPENSSDLKQRLDALPQRLLKEHGVQRLRDLPVSIAGAKMMEIEEYTDEQFEQIQTDLNARFAQQDQFVEWFETLSPYLAVRSASMAFAGTDRQHHDAFLGAVEDYRRNFVRTMNLADTRNQQPGSSSEERRAFWGQVPPFQQTFPSGKHVAQVAGRPLMMLALWCIAGCALTCIPPRRPERKEIRNPVWNRLRLPVSSEVALALTDPPFQMTLAVLALMTFLACLPGLHQFQLRRERCQKFAAQNESARQILESAFSLEANRFPVQEPSYVGFSSQQVQDFQFSARSPDLLAHDDNLWWTWSPPTPLASLAIGESAAWPDHYRLSGSSRSATLRRDVLENPFHSQMGSFDLTLFVATIFPLGVIALTYGLISAERERGTLALLVSLPISPWRLFGGRCLIRVASAAFIVVAISFFTNLVHGNSLLQSQAVVPFLLWSVALFLYALFWGMLALLVNTFKGSTTTNALWLLFCWTGFVLIIPATVAGQVSRAEPVPSPSHLALREREILAECEADSQKHSAASLSLLASVDTESTDQSSPQPEVVRYWRMKADVCRRFQSVLDEELQPYRFRDRDLNAWGWLSPVIAWRQAAVHLAGTSLADIVTLPEGTNRFQDAYVLFFESYSVADRELTLADIRRIPRFQPSSFQSFEDGKAALAQIMQLLIWIGAVGAIACCRMAWGLAVK